MIALEARRHPALRSLRALALLAACAMLGSGCLGGSGSSGFDILESQAISRVTEGQQCEIFDGLLICPAGTAPGTPPTPTATPTRPVDFPSPPPTVTATPDESAAPNGTPTAPALATPTAPPPTSTATDRAPTATHTPTPTTIPSPGIATSTGESGLSAACVGAGSTGCTVEFEFTPFGFSTETAYRVASRLVGVEAPWDISQASPSTVSGDPFAYGAALPVELAPTDTGSAGPEMLQVVVLVFERNPGPVPSRVDTLSATGADAAFAVAPFPIEAR